MPRSKVILSVLIIILVGAGLKAWLLLRGVFPFNSDEAIVALMARHILGGERPIFFYGQAYMGSLDAFLIAIGFFLLSPQVWVIRVVQSLLYILTIIATVLTGRVAFRSWVVGIVAGLLLAIPTVNVTLYTTVSLGGYGEALLIGALLLLVSFQSVHSLSGMPLSGKPRKTVLWPGVWGFLAGLGLWANGITLVYAIPSGVAILYAIYRKARSSAGRKLFYLVGMMAAGFLIGSSPWWVYLIQNGIGPLVQELFGSAVAVETGSWLQQVFHHFISLFLLGGTVTLGLRPPWEVRWLALPLIPLVLIFWTAVTFYWVRGLFSRAESRGALRVLIGVPAVVTAGFLFTSFGVDPSGRYFVPLVIPLSLAAANFVVTVLAKRRVQYAAVGTVLVFNLIGTVQCALRNPPGLTTQFYSTTIIDHRYDGELIRFLEEKSEKRGYTNYWTAYPLAFLSGEELIFVPKLPYHLDLRYTARDNRYLPYDGLVRESPRVAYITTRNPALDAYLKASFKGAGAEWQEARIGDYTVYYGLSKVIHPEEIGLGK